MTFLDLHTNQNNEQSPIGELTSYITNDGSFSLINSYYKESYHSSSGARKEAEEKFYKNYIKTEDFKIKFNKKKEFENYKDILRSKVIIGFSSTMLREAFAFDKKILCVDFANITNIEFPSGGICLLKKDNYDLFEERLKKIESLSFEEYLNEIETVSSIYQRDANTLDYFNQQI